MAAPMEDPGGFENEDLYANLGVPKDAGEDDIRGAFRRLSRMYHPDKHTDPKKKEDAVILFNKVKYAYEVLIDPQQRAIYDTLGLDAVKTEGWTVVLRTKTPAEIREEYERLAREREERLLNLRTNPRGSVNIGIDATDVFDRYGDVPEYGQSFPSIEISNMSISQSVEAPLTAKDTAVLSGGLSTQNGTGSGSIAASLKRTVSDSAWMEGSVSAGSGPGFGLKGFKTITKRIYGTMAGSMQITPRGLKPSIMSMLAIQLDKNLQGRLTWNAGAPSSMNTSVFWDNAGHRIATGFHLGLAGSYLSVSYTRKFMEQDMKIKGAVKVGTFGGIVEYGFDKKISQFSVFGASMVIGVPTGVLLKLKLSRGNQTYHVPIHLSETVQYEAIFYGTLVPLAAFYIIAKLLVDPVQREEKRKEKERQKAANAELMKQRKLEAEAARELMREAIERIRGIEESRKGLIIVKALYGKLVSESDEIDESVCLDVTDPLQALVKNSQLILPKDQSKSGLPGFYDPCMNEEKVFYVRYRFRDKLHQVTVHDMDDLRCPLQRHIITTSETTANQFL